GSKVVFAAAGEKKRQLATELPAELNLPRPFNKTKLAIRGGWVLEGADFRTYEEDQKVMRACREGARKAVLEGMRMLVWVKEQEVMRAWCEAAKDAVFEGIAMLVLVDDAEFTAENVNNFVWVTFTKSNPAYDMYGIKSFTRYKHWGCEGPVIIDARRKPHHAPELSKDETVERRVDLLGQKGGSLYGII